MTDFVVAPCEFVELTTMQAESRTSDSARDGTWWLPRWLCYRDNPLMTRSGWIADIEAPHIGAFVEIDALFVGVLKGIGNFLVADRNRTTTRQWTDHQFS